MTSAIIFIVIVILTGFLRRAVSHRRTAKKEDKHFESYLRRHEREAELQLLSMKKEAARFDAGEALAPVEAGLNEILELHGSAVDLVLRREDDTLILGQPTSPQTGCAPRIEVTWVRRSATLTHKGKNRSIFGNGHWEVSLGDGMQEPFMELAPLMGRLSALIRERAEVLRNPEVQPDGRTFPISTCGGETLHHSHSRPSGGAGGSFSGS